MFGPVSLFRVVLRLLRVGHDLRRIGFEQSRKRWLSRHKSMAKTLSPQSLGRWVNRVGRWVPGSRCLDRSLSLASLLADQGTPCSLMIGANKPPQGLAAHAWVEFDGQPIAEIDDPRLKFVVLERWSNLPDAAERSSAGEGGPGRWT
jgi:hypothetical protein